MTAPFSDGLPAAVLWDMDGTLVDTEPYWIAAEHELVAEHGGVWTDEHAPALVGNPLTTSAEYIRRHGGVDLPVPVIVEWLIDRVVAARRPREGRSREGRHVALKYLASGWCTTRASVDCSGCSCSSSESSTPMRSGRSRATSLARSSSSGQAGYPNEYREPR